MVLIVKLNFQNSVFFSITFFTHCPLLTPTDTSKATKGKPFLTKLFELKFVFVINYFQLLIKHDDLLQTHFLRISSQSTHCTSRQTIEAPQEIRCKRHKLKSFENQSLIIYQVKVNKLSNEYLMSQ